MSTRGLSVYVDPLPRSLSAPQSLIHPPNAPGGQGTRHTLSYKNREELLLGPTTTWRCGNVAPRIQKVWPFIGTFDNQMPFFALSNTMSLIEGMISDLIISTSVFLYSKYYLSSALSPSPSQVLSISKLGLHPQHLSQELPIQDLHGAPAHARWMCSSSQRSSFGSNRTRFLCFSS